jgi:hypothetical protein
MLQLSMLSKQDTAFAVFYVEKMQSKLLDPDHQFSVSAIKLNIQPCPTIQYQVHMTVPLLVRTM